MTEPILNTLDRAEAALFALRSSTRRSQVKAVLTSLKNSHAMAHADVARVFQDAPSNESGLTQACWNKAIDLILEEKV